MTSYVCFFILQSSDSSVYFQKHSERCKGQTATIYLSFANCTWQIQ